MPVSETIAFEARTKTACNSRAFHVMALATNFEDGDAFSQGARTPEQNASSRTDCEAMDNCCCSTSQNLKRRRHAAIISATRCTFPELSLMPTMFGCSASKYLGRFQRDAGEIAAQEWAKPESEIRPPPCDSVRWLPACRPVCNNAESSLTLRDSQVRRRLVRSMVSAVDSAPVPAISFPSRSSFTVMVPSFPAWRATPIPRSNQARRNPPGPCRCSAECCVSGPEARRSRHWRMAL